MVNSERGLFFGKFDKTVDSFSQLLSVSNEFEVRDIAKRLGGAVVKKLMTGPGQIIFLDTALILPGILPMAPKKAAS